LYQTLQTLNKPPLALLALLMLLALVGCRPQAPAPAGQRLTDDLGRVVAVPLSPKRVLSLAPSNTEWMFALGAGDLLVGRTDACDFPTESARVPSVGSLFPPDLEGILRLQPDLVLMIEGLADLRATLSARGLPVLVLQPRDIEGIFGNIALLGQALGRPQEAQALATRLRTQLDALPPVAGAPRVLFEIWPDPLTAVGPRTFTDALLRRAGGQNVVSGGLGDWPQISLETVVQQAPTVIIASSEESAQAIRAGQRPGLSKTPAALSGRVVVPPDADWLVRPGPRFVLGLEWLGTALRAP
jgi:iron complex transport system substrate-binding protein